MLRPKVSIVENQNTLSRDQMAVVVSESNTLIVGRDNASSPNYRNYHGAPETIMEQMLQKNRAHEPPQCARGGFSSFEN